MGKTSLVNTVKNFIENPTEDPIPVLTQEHEQLLETQVLEVYDEIGHKSVKQFQAKLNSQNPVLVKFEGMHKYVTNCSRLKVRIVDLGGQKEYKVMSSLFISSSGLFIICVDFSNLQPSHLETEFYPQVDTYIDQVIPMFLIMCKYT